MRPHRLVLLAALLSGVAHSQAGFDPSDVRVRVGDDARWARPDWDDGDWATRWLYSPPDTAAVLWIRQRVAVGPGARPLGIAVYAVAAREVYWDGVLVGRSGRVGTDAASEVPGPIDAVHAVPDTLAGAGVHTVALRLSTFRRPPSVGGYVHGVAVGDVRALARAPLRGALVPLLFLGGFVLVALTYGVLYGVDRRRTPYLLTALLCLAVAALLGAESWRALVGYTYNRHLARLLAVTALTCAVGGLLPAVFLVQFEAPWRRVVGAGLAVGIGLALLAPGGYDAKALGVFAVALVVALGVTAWAALRRKPGAGLALAGVAVCTAAFAATGFRFLDTTFFPAFAVLTAGLLASLGLQTRERRRQHEAALRAAARLEAELVKKNLQPHFLMNTLTSAIEWVETDPATGVRALEALAGELRALDDVTGEPLVPLAREVALCRAHLGVMSFRRDVRFALDADGVDPDVTLPPAVLHTLVENAVTHNAYPPGDVRLSLREDRPAGRRRYTLRAPVAGPADPDPGAAEGGGLGYVRARLAECYGDDWALASAVEDGDWVTRITVPA